MSARAAILHNRIGPDTSPETSAINFTALILRKFQNGGWLI